jgi:membrane protein DedA with SNARE-associated domain
VTDLLRFLESLPPGPLYGLIAALAAVENVFPPVPADMAVALGAFLAGRGVMDAWLVFAVTWTANVGSGAAVYALARRHGRALFQGVLGRRLFSDVTIARIEEQYRRHGTWGIFVSRLFPVWRGLVMPFAGIARVPPWRALVPLALASGLYYGALTLLVTTLGTNLEDVLRLLRRVNTVLGIVAVIALAAVAVWIVRRLKR